MFNCTSDTHDTERSERNFLASYVVKCDFIVMRLDIFEEKKIMILLILEKHFVLETFFLVIFSLNVFIYFF